MAGEEAIGEAGGIGDLSNNQPNSHTPREQIYLREYKLLEILLSRVLVAAFILALILALNRNDFKGLDGAGLNGGIADELVKITRVLNY